MPSPLKEQHDGFLAAFSPDRGIKQVLGSGQRLDGEHKDGTRFPVEVGISAFVLRKTLHNGGLSLALQTKIRLADRRIAGAEVLVRWIDDELGLVQPSEFIPIAERLGLIGCITDEVMRQSMHEIAACVDQSITVAVNLPALDFLQPHHLETIAEGVETEEQADLLGMLKVDLCQGYLFGKPVSPTEFHDLVRRTG